MEQPEIKPPTSYSYNQQILMPTSPVFSSQGFHFKKAVSSWFYVITSLVFAPKRFFSSLAKPHHFLRALGFFLFSYLFSTIITTMTTYFLRPFIAIPPILSPGSIIFSVLSVYNGQGSSLLTLANLANIFSSLVCDIFFLFVFSGVLWLFSRSVFPAEKEQSAPVEPIYEVVIISSNVSVTHNSAKIKAQPFMTILNGHIYVFGTYIVLSLPFLCVAICSNFLNQGDWWIRAVMCGPILIGFYDTIMLVTLCQQGKIRSILSAIGAFIASIVVFMFIIQLFIQG